MLLKPCPRPMWRMAKAPVMTIRDNSPDNKVYGANMGPTWVLSAPGGPHVGPMNFAIWVPQRDLVVLVVEQCTYE